MFLIRNSTSKTVVKYGFFTRRAAESFIRLHSASAIWEVVIYG